MAERPGEPPEGGRDARWGALSNVLAALRLGLSIGDLRRLTVAEFVAIADLAAGGGGDAPRQAAQADIDAFLG